MALLPIRRPDFNQSLIHLTRDRIEFPDGPFDQTKRIPAFDVLKEILVSGRIIGSGNAGYVKGTRRAVCLSEIPLSNLHLFAGTAADTRYSPYGIAVSKRGAFNLGARPVIYLPDAEGDWMPDGEKWRHVRYEHGQVDFTHEREWRAPDELVLAGLPGFYVIVWTAGEADEIRALEGCPNNIRGILALEHLNQML